MAFFLRFTNNPILDLQRGSSYHFSSFSKGFHSSDEEKEIKYVAEMFGCDSDDIEYIDNKYVQALGGLCGFELDSEDLEDAIDEAKKINVGSYSFEAMKDIAYIFEGQYYDSCPEGAVFNRGKLIQKIKE